MLKILISQNSNRFNFYFYILNLRREENVSQNTFAHLFFEFLKSLYVSTIHRGEEIYFFNRIYIMLTKIYTKHIKDHIDTKIHN